MEVAGSFNGWQHIIKMDSQPLASSTDSPGSRSSLFLSITYFSNLFWLVGFNMIYSTIFPFRNVAYFTSLWVHNWQLIIQLITLLYSFLCGFSLVLLGIWLLWTLVLAMFDFSCLIDRFISTINITEREHLTNLVIPYFRKSRLWTIRLWLYPGLYEVSCCKHRYWESSSPTP